MCPRSLEANMSLLRSMMFQYSGGSSSFWHPKIHLLLQWYTVWLDTIQILGRSLGEQKGNILPSELLWMAHCHLKQTRRKCTTVVLHNFFSQGRTGPSLAGTGGEVWHVFGDTFFCGRSQISRVVWWNTAQSGHGLSKLYEVLVWFEINIHMYQQPAVYPVFF